MIFCVPVEFGVFLLVCESDVRACACLRVCLRVLVCVRDIGIASSQRRQEGIVHHSCEPMGVGVTLLVYRCGMSGLLQNEIFREKTLRLTPALSIWDVV